MSVVIETTIGDVTVDLFVKERPKACLNFIKLCKLKFYNYNLFHTIESGFIAQTGDPSGSSDGGESVWSVIEGPKKKYFEAELIPKILHAEPGLLSMVSTGENFIGSQFFFTLGADLTSLDGTHCVIGEVVEGHEVIRALNEAIVDDKYRPFKDIRITHTVILEDPFNDPRGFRQPSRSPSPSAERLKNGRIAADEDIDDTDGKTEAEIHEMLQEREAKARATILEIVGDLPVADVAPPENVLFVCKLNPVTTDDDLQIIFSRFGKIKTCEVIRDKVSSDSLQYAFIEFEDQKSCEDAYFKMDNVLIDDRRIHVDFSQSVSKVKWRGKGNYTIHEDDGRFKSVKIFREGSEEPVVIRRRSRSPRRNRGGANTGGGDRRINKSPRYQQNYRMNQRRYEDRRFRNNDNRRRYSRSPRRYSPPIRRDRSPVRRHDERPMRRSRERKKYDREISPKRFKKPRRSRSPSSASHSVSDSSPARRDVKRKKKSSRKEKKKSSKKKRSHSSSSSRSDSSTDRRKKSRK